MTEKRNTATTLTTHYGLGADAITNIEYDYDGPNGCQRKLVYATNGTVYVYHQLNNAWRIASNETV